MFLRTRNIIYLIGILVIVASCSGYEKLLKSRDYQLKYQKAFEYYHDEDYVKAQNLFEQLVPIFGGTNQADSVNFYHAMTHFKLGDYILAGHHFKNFTTIYGNSPFAEEAEYLRAYCFYMNSPRPELDQGSTYQAIEAFQLFAIRYPNSSRIPETLKYVEELQNKLVEKSFISAKLYFDLEEYKAAIIALNNSLREYPDTKYREEIMFLILKSRFLLAENSVEEKKPERYQAALDEYYSFIDEFPESDFQKEAEKMYRTTGRFLQLEDVASSN